MPVSFFNWCKLPTRDRMSRPSNACRNLQICKNINHKLHTSSYTRVYELVLAYIAPLGLTQSTWNSSHIKYGSPRDRR